jgi:hypothetical protein
LATNIKKEVTDSTKKYLRSKLYKNIKTDLIDQIERNGSVGKFYYDLVNDYMDMWVTKCLLIDDIQARGVTITYDNGGGQRGIKKNDSVEQLIKINGQMLKLLNELEIKPSTSYGSIGGDGGNGGDGDEGGEEEHL